MESYTIDGGGVTAATAGVYTLGGTIGQHDAGVLIAAPFECQGGFWNTDVVAPPPCYADCDGVGGLTGNDFQCFLNAYVAGSSYADCDGVGGLTANDFQCFLNNYVAGCS